MQSIHSQVQSKIKEGKKGKIYFPSDFISYGNSETIKKILLRLEKAGVLVRLARGIYLYPEIDEKLGLGIIYPTVEDIAKEIAKRDNARIVPTGLYALNALGLSTQVPMNVVFLTDGEPRQIQIYKRKITFKHTAPKNVSYKSNVLMLVVSALKEIGKNFITETDLEKIKNSLSHESREIILSDLKLAPAWIREIIISLI